MATTTVVPRRAHGSSSARTRGGVKRTIKHVVCAPGQSSVKGYCRKCRKRKTQMGKGKQRRRRQKGKGLSGKGVKHLGRQIKKIWPQILPGLKSRFNM